MKKLRIILAFALITLSAISCRKTPSEESQDVVEDINDISKPVDDKIKKLSPEKYEKSEDEMIQDEINNIQDSLLHESIQN